MEPMADLAQQLEQVYQEWREAEGRVAQQRECDEICQSLPATPAGELERQYQVLRSRFSSAYFSGSQSYQGDRLLSSPAFHLANLRQAREMILKKFCIS